MSLRRCPRCDGFVPHDATVCPNCDFSPRASRHGLSPLLTWIGAGATLITGCAVYGPVCATRLPDGGLASNDPSYTQCHPGEPAKCAGTRIADGGTVSNAGTGLPVCTDCLTETLPDGGSISNDPAFFGQCHPGNDGGTDGGP